MKQISNEKKSKWLYWLGLWGWSGCTVWGFDVTEKMINSGLLMGNGWRVATLCFGWLALGYCAVLIDKLYYRTGIKSDNNKPFWDRVLDFSGKATRREFWSGLIVYGLITYGVMKVIMSWTNNGMLAIIACLVFLIPLWALFVRRLHDIGTSGWWAAFPCVGAVMCVLSWFITVFFDISYYIHYVGVDIVGLMIYFLSALFIGVIPSKQSGKKRRK